MRLLNTRTLSLANFIAKPPSYVILSHTWGKEEVTFQDIQQLNKASSLEGFPKVASCCRQAVADGYEWAWIDMCCFDKTLSSELSEAVNSMYKWYQNSGVCSSMSLRKSFELLSGLPRGCVRSGSFVRAGSNQSHSGEKSKGKTISTCIVIMSRKLSLSSQFESPSQTSFHNFL
jgi:hypothetical protein